ncbi:SixA phosphatase family protein [Alteraurantiacibacter aquimixticola]|uniref:Histidine phosphatase family protein n=1 Tax=Alteraurantiacibacter aquimixticola TaxID=2489173 RepID=A0A4T3FA07_9SPHN|nr:histidine phosphatase family protein [Alteraurantiacibacter aquimixticola]TIX51870.1 histidine phosphatase family protein [Alteraurantiacibacter aquimixticola]
MKLLGLLRHAKSDWDDLSLRDFDRGLNDRGRKGAGLMGAHISDHGVKWDAIVASPAERVKCTLEASGLGLPITYATDAYMGDAATLIRLLREHGGDARALLLAAHNPGLQELALQLVPAEKENALFEEVMEKFPTAAFAVFELDIDDWADCEPGCGKLVHFARPRDLDPELGPERVN